MTTSLLPHPATRATGNGAPRVDPGAAAHRDSGPRSPLLAKLTSLTSIATVAAAGLMVVGVLALVGGNYDKQVVRDQLVPQKIFFPPAGSPALLPGIKQYAGQQVVNGDQARAYADKFINVHLSKIAAGQTYAQVATAALAAPSDTKLAAQKATLFQGETLRGLLLGGWGWAMIGTIATVAGVMLLALGAILLLLPLANWQVNLRGRHSIA